MKIALAAIGVAGFTVAALTGCSSNSSPSSGGKHTIVVWARPSTVSADVLASAKKKFPNLTIKFVADADIDTHLQSALRTKSGIPDIAFLGGNISDYFEVGSQFLNLDKYGFSADKKNYLPNPLKGGQLPDGTQIAMPTDIGAWSLFYNATQFKALGFPTDPTDVSSMFSDWDAYQSYAEKAKAAGKYLCDESDQVYNLLVQQQGYHWLKNDNGKVVNDFDNPINKASFDTAATWAQKGLCAEEAPYSTGWSAALSQNKMIAFEGPAYEMGPLKTAATATSGQWRTADSTGGPAMAGGSFVSVMAATKDPTDAVKLAEFFSSPAVQVEAYTSKWLIPSAVAAYSNSKVTGPDPFFGNQKAFAPIANSSKNGPYVFNAPGFSAIETDAGTDLNNIATTHANPDAQFATLKSKYGGSYGESQ
jgi:cellobiose transport system substrate-binding protein